MEMLCPECMGPLTSPDGKWATCTLHGGRYEILFMRPASVAAPVKGPSVAPPAPGPSDQPKAMAPEKVKTQCLHCGQRYWVDLKDVGRTTRCKTCHSEFELVALVEETDVSSPPQPIAQTPAPQQIPTATTCPRHPTAQVSHQCARCQTPVCATCEFPQPDGTYLCPDCVMRANQPGGAVAAAVPPGVPAAVPAAPVVPLGTVCRWHPNTQAVQICKACGAAMCQTCDFVFPGNLHLCPACATAPQQGLTGKRRAYLIWSYVLAVWATVVLAFIMSGALADSVQTEEDAMALGVAMLLLILVPAIIGTALGSAAMRRNSKPISVWVATIWNAVLIGAHILLCIIGSFSG